METDRLVLVGGNVGEAVRVPLANACAASSQLGMGAKMGIAHYVWTLVAPLSHTHKPAGTVWSKCLMD